MKKVSVILRALLNVNDDFKTRDIDDGALYHSVVDFLKNSGNVLTVPSVSFAFEFPGDAEEPIPYDEQAHFANVLVVNPDVVFECQDGTLWKYESKTKRFLYRKPNNRVRNRWYEGYGLARSWERYIRIFEGY